MRKLFSAVIAECRGDHVTLDTLVAPTLFQNKFLRLSVQMVTKPLNLLFI